MPANHAMPKGSMSARYRTACAVRRDRFEGMEEQVRFGIVDLKTMARILGVSQDTIRSLALSGEIPAFKVGRLWRFDSTRVLEHLNRPRDPWAQSRRSRGRKRRD